jgi:CHAT domain-containing protein
MKQVWVVFILVFLSTCTTPSIIATREQQKGDLHFNQFRYQEAVEHYKNFLNASVKLGVYRNLRMEAEVYRKIAHSHTFQGEYQLANEYLNQAIVSDSLDKYVLGIIESYKDKGRVALIAGRMREGIQYLEYALNLGRKNEESFKDIKKTSAANIYLSLAQAYLSLGRFQQALEITGRAHELFTQIEFEQGVIETTLLLGIIRTDQGNLQEALSYLKNSEDLAVRSGMNTVRQNLVQAEIAGMLGDFKDALQKIDQAIQEANRVQIIPQMIWTYIRAGDLYELLGDTKNANLLFNHAYQFYERTRESEILSASLGLRYNELEGVQEYFQKEGLTTQSGLLYLKLAESAYNNLDYSDALKYYILSDSIFHETGHKEGIAHSKLGIAKVVNNQNEPELSLENLRQVFTLSKNKEIIWQSFYEKGLAMEGLGLFDSAMVAYQQAIDIIEGSRGSITPEELKGLYLNNKIKVYDRLIQLFIRDDQIEESLLIAERARARSFLDMLGNKSPRKDDLGEQELIYQEQELNLKLTHLQKQLYELAFSQFDFARSLEIERTITEELSRTQDEYEFLLNRIKVAHPDYYQIISIDPPYLREIQEAIPLNSATLIYWLSEDELFLWVVRSKKIELVRIDVDMRELQQSVMETNRLLKHNLTERSVPLLEKLYKILIQPAESHLENVNKLCIIPHGTLHILPFHALISPGKQYLTEDFFISYMPSSSVMVEMTRKTCQTDGSFLGLALGDKMIGNFIGLPGTTYELINISDQFSDPLLVFEDESTERFLKQNSSGKEIIHIATHGFFNEIRPRYSFLLFAPDESDDGQLTVNEILNLDLNACIVTLSACETGLSEISKGDELTGLSRAFLGAGANTVSVSLWSVADRPTAELMISYYNHMKTDPPYMAMTMAQRETMKKYPEPFYWAPFVVIGGKL